jgi:hypothetical protein
MALTGQSTSPSKLSRMIRAYQSSSDRDTRTISRWLESRTRSEGGYLDATGATAVHRLQCRSRTRPAGLS